MSKRLACVILGGMSQSMLHQVKTYDISICHGIVLMWYGVLFRDVRWLAGALCKVWFLPVTPSDKAERDDMRSRKCLGSSLPEPWCSENIYLITV